MGVDYPRAEAGFGEYDENMNDPCSDLSGRKFGCLGCMGVLSALLGILFVLYLILYFWAFNARIEFDGIVVDHQGKPVAGAVVSYRIQRAEPIPIPFVDVGFVDSVGSKTSGQDGTFHFRWRRGELLSIKAVTAAGYRDSLKDPRSFTYRGYPGEAHRPMPNHPERFLVVPKDMPRVQQVRAPELRFRWNVGDQEFPLDGGVGVLVVTPTRTLIPEMGLRTPWEMSLRLTGAQLAPANHRDPLAAADGYQDSIHITLKDKEQMLRSGPIYYDFRTTSGRYGRMRFYVYPTREDMGHPNASLLMILAPEGSRGLGLTFSP